MTRLFLISLALVTLGFTAAHAQGQPERQPGEEWTEEFQTKWGWPPGFSEEYVRKYPPTINVERRAKERNAVVVSIKKQVEVESRPDPLDKGTTLWKSRCTYVVTFRKTRGLMAEEATKLKILQTLIKQVGVDMNRLLEAFVASRAKFGRILSGTAPVHYANALQRTLADVKAFNDRLRKLQEAPTNDFVDQIARLEQDLSSSQSRVQAAEQGLGQGQREALAGKSEVAKHVGRVRVRAGANKDSLENAPPLGWRYATGDTFGHKNHTVEEGGLSVYGVRHPVYRVTPKFPSTPGAATGSASVEVSVSWATVVGKMTAPGVPSTTLRVAPGEAVVLVVPLPSDPVFSVPELKVKVILPGVKEEPKENPFARKPEPGPKQDEANPFGKAKAEQERAAIAQAEREAAARALEAERREKARKIAAERARESAKQATQNLGETQTTASSVLVECWDHGSEDGDQIVIRLNGEDVRRLTLSKSPDRIRINLYKGTNALEIRALSEGSSPPNTASVVVSAAGKRIAAKEWELKTGENAMLVVLRVD